MATTGTTAFNLDFGELAEEAFERAGREMRTGYDLRTARRSMNLMTIEWANRGINLWTIDEGYLNLTKGDSDYALPADTVDLCEMNIRENDGVIATQSDTNLNRISVSTYSAIPNKKTQGKPLQAVIHRLGGKGGYKSGQDSNTTTSFTADAPFVRVWPVPDKTDTYRLYYYRVRRIEDAGNGVETQDLPFRFLPCAVAGLAYYIAMKIPELMPRLQMLKQEYEEQFAKAAAEDRVKTSARFVPSIGYH
jgi:hypothetical protein|tara:strand:- start:667 stop:1413 length:747 start_codon:yes stop_codon:yes gene_type:complete